ncbi:hypothetical protein AXW83_21345 [Bosea sp. PAMC 26642]|nr:hypothetical protein AXW83_21345 [Bosea sp. PAMC 26642]
MIMPMNSNLRRGRGAGRQELAEGGTDGLRVEPDQRAHEAAEALACFPGARDVDCIVDPGVEQHLLQLRQVGRRQRATMADLLQHDVVLVLPEDVARLGLEAREVGLADLGQLKLEPSPISSVKSE